VVKMSEENKWYKTTVEIGFQLKKDQEIDDFEDEEEALIWLNPDNIHYILGIVCKNTNFTVKKVDKND